MEASGFKLMAAVQSLDLGSRILGFIISVFGLKFGSSEWFTIAKQRADMLQYTAAYCLKRSYAL